MKGAFFFLLVSTLVSLLFPIVHQDKMIAEKSVMVKKYRENYRKVAPTSLDYQTKYNDYLMEIDTIALSKRPDFQRVSDTDGVIGTLSFPTVHLSETPLYKEEMKECLFHYKQGSLPTTGKSEHTVLTIKDRWKNLPDLVKLTQLKVGDCFYLRIGNQISVYQITTIQTGDTQEERKVILDEGLLTIERKNLLGFTNDQIIIKSRKIAKETLQKVNITPKIVFSYQTFVIVFLLLNSLLFGWLVLCYQKYVRKAHAIPYRTKNGGYRKLRRLLQITRGYYILLGLIMSFYLAVMVYRFFYLNKLY